MDKKGYEQIEDLIEMSQQEHYTLPFQNLNLSEMAQSHEISVFADKLCHRDIQKDMLV